MLKVKISKTGRKATCTWCENYIGPDELRLTIIATKEQNSVRVCKPCIMADFEDIEREK